MKEGHDLFVEVGEARFAAVGGDDAVVAAQVSVRRRFFWWGLMSEGP